jgi:putative transposase
MKYRRIYIPGGTFFFTLVTHHRQQVFHSPIPVQVFMKGYQEIQRTHPFESIAMVVLPDHLHAIWTLPEQDANYSTRWRLIKSHFTMACKWMTNQSDPIWQNRFWEHLIRDESDLQRHVDYIHYNPVKHGWAQSPTDWQYSSIHRFIREGLLPADWGGTISADLDEAIGRE